MTMQAHWTRRVIGCGSMALAAMGARADHNPGHFHSNFLGFDLGTDDQMRLPYAQALGDFDGDGDIDVASPSWGNFAKLSIILNNGDGTLGEPAIYPLAMASQDIVAADFDGDGDLDLLAANTGVNWEGNTVSLFRNHGDGTFQSQQQFSVGSGQFVGPTGLAAADFDLDGDIDLAVAKYGYLGQGSTIALLRNNGDGTFAAPQSFPAGASPYMLVAADLNGDGFPDLAIAADDKVRVLINSAGAGFAAPVSYNIPGFQQAGSYPAIAAADVDLDGDIDLLYGNALLRAQADFSSPFAVALYRNQGNGTFAPVEAIELGAFSGSYVGIAVADVTGDGWPDLMGTGQSNGGWSVVPGLGNGEFGAYQGYFSGQDPFDIAAADMDGDGDLEAVILNRASINVNVHFNPGPPEEGDFSGPPSHALVSLFSELDAADVDNDGDIDLAAAYFNLVSGGGVQILRNDGAGGFATSQNYPHTHDAFDPHLVDLNADGFADLMWGNESPPYDFKYRLNNGNGSLGAMVSGPVGTCGTSDILPHDLDNDGDIDVVMAEWLGCVNVPLSARRIFIVENVGSPGNPQFALNNIIVIDPFPGGVAVGDFNGDGVPDIAATSQPINVLLGKGDLTYNIIPASQMPSIPIVTADFNGDGHLDLAVGAVENTSFHPGVGIMLGYGDGSFMPVIRYPGSYSPNLGQIQELEVLDADGDGDLDVIAANYASNDLSFWANNGDGTFARHVRYGAGLSHPGDVDAADFTGDGVTDLATPVTTQPPLSGRAVILAGQQPKSPTLPGDITGDGVVNVNDLLMVIGAWGPCPAPPAPCPADIAPQRSGAAAGDGAVNVADLLMVIGNWS